MSNDTYALFQMTLKEKIKFPKDFDVDAKSLIKHLCKHDLSERYGNLINGVKDIKKHRFFDKLDWFELNLKKLDAPYLPDQKVKQEPNSDIKIYAELPESSNEKEFPKIKPLKDVFSSFF